MSLYIHQENQKLLWESMSQFPLFQELGNGETGVKESWFRNIIEKFYENNRFKLLSLEEVQQLNRETVSYMIEELKKETKKRPEIGSYNSFSGSGFGDIATIHSPPSMSFSSLPMENKEVTRDAILEKKQSQLQEQFSLKQQEYGNMMKSGPDFEIDFRAKEKEEDKPIENMDKLMESVMKQREYELKTQPGPSLDVIDLGNSKPVEDGAQRSQRFPYKDITDNPPKSVSWSTTMVQEPVKHRPPQYSGSVDTMSVFKDFMEDIKDSMNTMKNEISSLKQTNRTHTRTQDTNKQNPLVNGILSRMKKVNTSPLPPSSMIPEKQSPRPLSTLQDVTNEFFYE